MSFCDWLHLAKCLQVSSVLWHESELHSFFITVQCSITLDVTLIFLNPHILTVTVKIAIHHDVFAQRLSASIKITQLCVLLQILYLQGGPQPVGTPLHPSSLAVSFVTWQLASPFDCGFWSREVEGSDGKGIQPGEKISLTKIKHLGVSLSIKPAPTL